MLAVCRDLVEFHQNMKKFHQKSLQKLSLNSFVKDKLKIFPHKIKLLYVLMKIGKFQAVSTTNSAGKFKLNFIVEIPYETLAFSKFFILDTLLQNGIVLTTLKCYGRRVSSQ